MSPSKVYIITGSIASGKSSVGRFIEEAGFPVIDADLISRGIYEDERLLGCIVKHFGIEVLKENGEMDRKALAKLIFGSTENRKTLNAITHKVIINKMKEMADRINSSIVFLEIPLYLEAKELIDSCFNIAGVIVVYIPHELQLLRLISRESIDRASANNMIEAQMNSRELLKIADYIIVNKGSVEELKVKTLEVLAGLTEYSS